MLVSPGGRSSLACACMAATASTAKSGKAAKMVLKSLHAFPMTPKHAPQLKVCGPLW